MHGKGEWEPFNDLIHAMYYPYIFSSDDPCVVRLTYSICMDQLDTEYFGCSMQLFVSDIHT